MIQCSNFEQPLMKTPTGDLADKEFLLIQEIARQPNRTQRDLSQSLGLSLGMTNLLIQRLARKGLIKVTQLDWKRTQYLLTLKGAMEKTRKTYRYTLYTMRLFKQIRENIETLLRREYDGGRRDFYLVAQDELLDLLRETVAELALPDSRFTFYSSYSEASPQADLLLTATLDAAPEKSFPRAVSLVDFNNISFRL